MENESKNAIKTTDETETNDGLTSKYMKYINLAAEEIDKLLKELPLHIKEEMFENLFHIAEYPKLTQEEENIYFRKQMRRWDNALKYDKPLSEEEEKKIEEDEKRVEAECKKAVICALEMKDGDAIVEKIIEHARLCAQYLKKLMDNLPPHFHKRVFKRLQVISEYSRLITREKYIMEREQKRRWDNGAVLAQKIIDHEEEASIFFIKKGIYSLSLPDEDLAEIVKVPIDFVRKVRASMETEK